MYISEMLSDYPNKSRYEPNHTEVLNGIVIIKPSDLISGIPYPISTC